ncbi:MAG: hypothetical protein M3Q96_07705 [Pseudomonadota bacterium]|nr:hypothetical protein [Pseudomonadota bacterium]
MRNHASLSLSFVPRLAAVAVLAVAMVGASGCRWFRKGDDVYKQSADNRPLEIPPDLDRPSADNAMAVPGGSVTASQTAAAGPQQAATTATPVGFTVPGERDAIFAKVGDALTATTGVTVASKAQILGTYDVNYESIDFLVRVTKVDAGVYISAVDPRGFPAVGAAPSKLIAALRASLGG